LGIGFTITVEVTWVPVQVTPALVYTGVMVKVTVTGALVVLVNEPLMFPEPLAAIPVTEPVLFLVQLYTVPATLPVNTIVVIAEPEQMVCAAGVATALGTGFTTTVAVTGVPVQVRPPLV
jgi:hypothetical protein